MDVAWYRVQEIERRLRDVENDVGVERSRLRQMIGEMRAIRQFGSDNPLPPANVTVSTVRVQGDAAFNGEAFAWFGINEISGALAENRRAADGSLLSSNLTNTSGDASVSIALFENNQLDVTCSPRFAALSQLVTGAYPSSVTLVPATGYRSLSIHGDLWISKWEAWKTSVRVTDSARGNALITSTTLDEAEIGTHNGSPVQYRVIRNGNNPAVRVRYFAGGNFLTLTVNLTTLTLPRAGTYQASGTYTGTPPGGTHPWGTGAVTFTITLDENQ